MTCCLLFAHDEVKDSNPSATAFIFNGRSLRFFRHLHSHAYSVEGDAKLKCYPPVFTTVHAHVLSCLCVHYGYVFECLCVWVCTQRERGRVGGRWGVGGCGGVSCSIWSLTCCGALLRPPCLEVSSAGIGRLHASSIRGSILLLPCRLLSWGLLNWA